MLFSFSVIFSCYLCRLQVANHCLICKFFYWGSVSNLVMRTMDIQLSLQIKSFWKAASLVALSIIWFARNMFFQDLLTCSVL